MSSNVDNMMTLGHCSHGSLLSSYSWTIQLLLATIAFTCLIVKRFCEPHRYRRPWLIWFFDTSKQAFGAFVVHFLNILLAEINSGRDPCTLYVISFLIDSSIGLLLLWLFIRLAEYIAIKYSHPYLIFGEYGKPEPLLRSVIDIVANQAFS
ncbi:store-operated calcium entry regulator STIMATE-like isoform X2 [Oppia nitens]|uniref:store-operated calcium entry regulator STIMATE-like isoform X2 n=1 Tax=Oppia nitens TaxID=1686743 RepID=UPI0023DCDBE5|nr:store-operated calcium entry regulator STIMATE-like isoform X2 [Oppia nitens]